MGTNAVAYGLIPVSHPTGQCRASQYRITSGYAVNIFKGDPVFIHTDGFVNRSAAGSNAGVTSVGVFAGCEYIDATGKPVVSPYWPASTTATNIKAYVYDDKLITYKLSTAGGTPAGYVQTAVGGHADIVIADGSTYTGVSASYASAVVAGALGNVRVIGFVNDEIYNATTNPYPEVLVQFAETQFAENAVGLA